MSTVLQLETSLHNLYRLLPDRTITKEIDQKLAAELEERDRELNARVMQATFEQVNSKLAADIETLKKAVPTAEKEARETALDVKYVKDRQMMLVTYFQGTCSFK